MFESIETFGNYSSRNNLTSTTFRDLEEMLLKKEAFLISNLRGLNEILDLKLFSRFYWVIFVFNWKNVSWEQLEILSTDGWINFSVQMNFWTSLCFKLEIRKGRWTFNFFIDWWIEVENLNNRIISKKKSYYDVLEYMIFI